MDLPQIAELWRRGSVAGSWLLDLTAGPADLQNRLLSAMRWAFGGHRETPEQ